VPTVSFGHETSDFACCDVQGLGAGSQHAIGGNSLGPRRSMQREQIGPALVCPRQRLCFRDEETFYY
jgi:hypothetical protein